ncbi:MAG: hypothetical protein V1754_14470 [Pseudomonadota bacterium]
MKKKTFKKKNESSGNENGQSCEIIEKEDLEKIAGGDEYGIIIYTPYVGK